jgi:segregation and condensation protein B
MSSGPPTPDPPEQPAISLQELTEAFAQAMGYPAATVEEQPASQPGPLPAEASTPAVAEEVDPCPISPQTILESLLFVGNRDARPVEAHQAAELMRGVTPAEIAGLVDALNGRYQQRGCPYYVIEEGAGYRLTLRDEFGSLRDRFYGRVRETRLSQAAVDVLAIVAYRQPVTADQIRHIRGKPSARLLSQLVRRGLLEIERSEGKPSKVQYRTAPRFLELFGIESLADLPQSEEPP